MRGYSCRSQAEQSILPTLFIPSCPSFIPVALVVLVLVLVVPVTPLFLFSLCSSILYNAIVVNCGPAGHLHNGCSGQHGRSGQGSAAMCCAFEFHIEELALTGVSCNAS